MLHLYKQNSSAQIYPSFLKMLQKNSGGGAGYFLLWVLGPHLRLCRRCSCRTRDRAAPSRQGPRGVRDEERGEAGTREGGQWWDAGMGGRQVSRMQSGKTGERVEGRRKKGLILILPKSPFKEKNPCGSAQDKTKNRKTKKSPRCKIYIYTPGRYIYVSGSKGEGGEGQR